MTQPLVGLLSVLMPVYNERQLLPQVVARVLAAPLPPGWEREIVLVDDGSTDGTAAVVAQLVASHPEVIRALRQPSNRGKGAAVARAVGEMRGQVALIQDADLEYDPADYGRLLAPLLAGEAQVVYGSRFAPHDAPRRFVPLQALANRLLTWLSNRATGLALTDMETCYKVFQADLLRSLPICSQGFCLEPELTAKLARRGVAIVEVPVAYQGRTRREGKKIGWRHGLAALWTILSQARQRG